MTKPRPGNAPVPLSRKQAGRAGTGLPWMVCACALLDGKACDRERQTCGRTETVVNICHQQKRALTCDYAQTQHHRGLIDWTKPYQPCIMQVQPGMKGAPV